MEEVREIIKQIKEQIEEDDFLEKIGDALRGQNKEEFEKIVKEKLKGIFDPKDINKPLDNLLKDYQFFAGGIHYISPSLGDWFRFNFGNKISLSNKLIDDELESTYKTIPKEYNLTTWDELVKPIKYLFKIENDDSEGSTPDKNFFILSKKDIKTLLQYMEMSEKIEESGNKFRNNYFKYVVGGEYSEKSPSIKEDVENSSKLKAILDEYYNWLDLSSFNMGDFLNQICLLKELKNLNDELNTSSQPNSGKQVWKRLSEETKGFIKNWAKEKPNKELKNSFVKDLKMIIKDKTFYKEGFFNNVVNFVEETSFAKKTNEMTKKIGKLSVNELEQLNWRLITLSFPNCKDYDRLFRLLTFSCIFTLLKLSEKDLEDEKKNYKFGLVIPFRVPYSDIIKQERLLNYGGFGGIFTESLIKEEIDDLTLIFEYIVNRLICLEISVLSHKGPEDLIVAEDTIRLCTRIDNDKVAVLKNKYSDFLKTIAKGHIEELIINNPTNQTQNDSKSIMKKVIDEEISKKFIGCNEHFIEILERILVTIKKEYEDNFKDVLEKDKEKKSYCSTIFLYGEEGAGKEILAKICHLINPRYYDSDYISKVIKFYYDNHYSKERNAKDNILFDRIMEIGGVKDLSSTELEEIELIKSHLPPNSPFFNYSNVNMATLDKDTFPKIIFGEKVFVKESEPFLGELEIVSVLGGTLFMDEIDKLDSKLANQLLKVLEGPYIYQRYGEKKKRYANLLIVFASNKRLEEFTRDTFSSAFIYRIGRNYFEIPPLRMRREDIALFIWDKIRSQGKEEIKSIDLKGLRLLCELPWLNNYRGLDSFIRTLFMEREIRHINSSEISFDEIIRVIRKLELLKKKSPR